MRQRLFTPRPGVLALLLAPGAALLLAGCGSGGTDEAGAGRPSAVRTSASASATGQSPESNATPGGGPSASSPAADDGLPVEPGPGTGPSDAVDEAFRAARSVALQSGLRYIDPALGTPESLAAADANAQCTDLQRDVANPDRLAAQRFSVGNHKVTEADGKRINVLLRNSYCG
ncbi:hypothetical protein IW294_19905 [Streptomyces olivaceus]|uniref:hypothetical protein n=1 Tax=Streptomyces olivaceus TaxID=47716 RepID=UPI0018A815B6|nr:hypothetical protein [Streptomyces olivaceus]MBF8173013.1 hypothetical protein [Streptomyces olivaceus]